MARALAKYRRMRDFSCTGEPRGGPARRSEKGRLSYFIQRHAASRLHYDFRLELDGTLKSWAVPKGPSLDPGQRRLAVHVEDHPLEYGTFEGKIPRGEYGAGTVLLWDLGRWIPEGDPAEGYRRRRLKFRLEGRKLRGRWSLVAMGGKAGEDGKNWLLIKENDEESRPSAEGEIVDQRPESVSGRAPRGGAKPAPLPPLVQPQLATLAESVPAGTDWVHEIKFDGYRVIARAAGDVVRLHTRHGLDWTGRFAPVAAALKRLAARSATIDGEIVVLDAQGRSDFQALQNSLSEGRVGALFYQAFDLLHLDGKDLRSLPLEERKRGLAALLEETAREAGPGFGARVRYTEHIEGGGKELLKRACELALEGVICKRRDAPYRAGERSREWLKVKCLHEQEFVIGGYSDPGGARKGFGALLLGVQEKGGLRYAGRVGTGFTQASLRELHAKLVALGDAECPFAKAPAGRDARGAHWVRPALVAEIAFGGWTSEGLVRQGSFQGLREDKPAREVTVEKPVFAPAARRAPGAKLSSPGRVLWPELGVTKGELAAYYTEIADWIMPQLEKRPLALLRCPSGRGKCFYQKHAGESFPRSIKAVPIREKDGTVQDYLYVDGLDGLMALVQLNVLELHPWGSRVGDVEVPDRMIFDLDPSPEAAWSAVLRAAREVKARLEALGLGAFVKTTGGKGLHVVVPISGRAAWPEVKLFSKALAGAMALEQPKVYTARLPKAERKGKIFVDYLRNERGATAVAAYSTRAREGATVSMPIFWEELKPSLDPKRFHLRSAPRRLASGKDPWADFERARRPLPKIA